MSGMSTGQIIGSVVGAVIGGIYGGPSGAMLGMSIGGMIGGYIDPPEADVPPAYGNVSVNTFTDISTLPLAYGQCKVYGGVVWRGEVGAAVEAGGSKKSVDYSTTVWFEFAVAHCEGEVQEYIKYWANETEITPADSNDYDVTSYLGTPTQVVDPDIDDYMAGADVPVPPFRHTAYSYVFFRSQASMLSSLPNFSAEIKAILTESGEEDANPIRVVYDFLTNTRYGVGMSESLFDGDPDTPGSSWYDAAAYCDDIVEYYSADTETTIYEPRFRFSHAFTDRSRAYDIVEEILKTCRGIVSWTQGVLLCRIENPDEDIAGYYSDEYIIDFTSTGASTVNRIYVNETISEADGFWDGSYLTFTMEDGEGNQIVYSEMVLSHTTTYFDLADDLSSAPTASTEIQVVKDNIKEGSFSWSKLPSSDKMDTVNIEFINRKFADSSADGAVVNEYLWDVVTYDNPTAYSTDDGYGTIYGDRNTRQVRLAGIKRKSQAMRMARYHAEFNCYTNFTCEFVTDVVGYFHAVGDVIAITRTELNWENKEFRITGMEENGLDEIKLTCLEYSRDIYDDAIDQVENTATNVTPSPLEGPVLPDRINIVLDHTDPHIILFLFNRPLGEPWWAGVNVSVSYAIGVGPVEIKSATFSYETPSIQLYSGGINDSQTTIPFQVDTLRGTAFPDNGYFWIEDELIEYTSINTELNQFEGCTRGYSTTDPAAHVDTEYCQLHSVLTYTAAITVSSEIVGTVVDISLRSVSSAGALSDTAYEIENFSIVP